MKPTTMKTSRCATRKSTEHNLDLAFNSLDAQRGLSSASNKGTVRFSVLAQRSSASTIRTSSSTPSTSGPRNISTGRLPR